MSGSESAEPELPDSNLLHNGGLSGMEEPGSEITGPKWRTPEDLDAMFAAYGQTRRADVSPSVQTDASEHLKGIYGAHGSNGPDTQNMQY